MAVGNVIFAVLIVLVAVNCIFAEKNPSEPGDKKQNHGPPSKENNNEKKQEGTISLLFDSSSPLLPSSCNATQGPNYLLSCTKDVLCHSASRGIALRCHGTLHYGNGSSSPGGQGKSA